MEKNLPARPNLDHLRRQAKTLLTALRAGDPEAAATILKHLPAATGKNAEQDSRAGFRLADAQSAIARKSGFGSWPHLARHVEQLRELEGTWKFARLEVDGSEIPASAVATSRLLIDGDRFRTESPEGIYEGVFNINVESDPHEIDIEFVAGPEAGNWNYGIFRLRGETLDICLDMNGRPRPAEFRSSAGSGHANESLRRISGTRPAEVAAGGGHAEAPAEHAAKNSGFEFVPCATLARLEGNWTAVVRDGQPLPAMMLRTALRSAHENDVRISFGGQTMIHALVRIGERPDAIHVDYLNLDGASQGTIQHGLLKWAGDEACFCMAAPGQPRPVDFSCDAGSGRTLSQWRAKK